MNWSLINKSIIFYSKVLDKNVNVYSVVIVCLGDQPERRGIDCILGANGKFPAIFDYCANIRQIKKLRSYIICMNKMIYDPFFLLKKNE